MGNRRISRRAALRGLGTMVALPMLEAMSPARGPSDLTAPTRMAFVYVPNGKHMSDWSPKIEGRDFELPPTLEPLRPVRDHLLVLSGLSLHKADANGDGPGDHARAMATFLTGRRVRKTDGADICAGISVDQVAALRLGRATRFASLEVGCEGGRNGGNCDHGYSCAYQTNLSWRSESTPMAKEVDPRLVFERLFGSCANEENAQAASRRQRERRSILDFVASDARNLAGRLGAADRRKLEEYLTGIRELEERIVRAQPVAEVGQARMVRPTGIPQDFREHARLLADLLVLAFRADLTRIGTFVLANDGSNRSYPEIGVADGHHDLSHHGDNKEKQGKLKKINRCHVAQFGYLLQRLKQVPEGSGSLLDHCMLVYGSGIADGDRHNHDGLPILLAGCGNGTLKPGRHIRCATDTPLTNLYVSLLQRMAGPVDSFGDSTGPLKSLESSSI
jgi:Protein of unknown function (DUF1552)